MREISTYIDANPGIVWEALNGFARFPAWNPYVREVTGEVRVGAMPALRTQPTKGRPVNFRARTTAVTEGIELRWAGGLPVPGLFGGDHTASPLARTTAGRGCPRTRGSQGCCYPL